MLHVEIVKQFIGWDNNYVHYWRIIDDKRKVIYCSINTFPTRKQAEDEFKMICNAGVQVKERGFV